MRKYLKDTTVESSKKYIRKTKTVPQCCSEIQKSKGDSGRVRIFCNHLQACDVSISLAFSKSGVSPLKAFQKSKNLIRFHHQAFIICKNGQSLKMLIEVIRQKVIVSNVWPFQTISNLEFSPSVNYGDPVGHHGPFFQYL